jgi:hypothetical protein
MGLKGWRVWDETQILTLLAAHPEVSKAFSALTTSNELVSKLLADLEKPARLPATSASVPRHAPGESGVGVAFQEAYDGASGPAGLGNALGLTREEGPGWVQHFSGGPDGEPAVVCALFNRPAVAVARSIWNEVAAIGRGGPISGMTGVGFPVYGPSSPSRFIGSDSESVNLAGGEWGRTQRGRIIRRRPLSACLAARDRVRQQREPLPRRLDQQHPTDLRVRVAVSIPL